MKFEKSKIYGVDKVGSENPDLSTHRTDDAVGLSFEVKANGEITSDFDKCYPWSDMKEVVDEYGNVFIRIPKFYAKITDNGDGTYKHQISGIRYEGFSTLFVDGKGNEIDYVLVGKYEGSGTKSRIYSRSGQAVITSITRQAGRIACRANGAGYQQYDFLIDAIIKELFIIEFATTDSQAIMAGWTNSENVAALETGHTDIVKTPSGSGNKNHETECSACNTDGLHACKYRGIENLWGNLHKYVDGVNFYEKKIYVCEDAMAYEDDKYDAPYSYMGEKAIVDGYAKKVEPLSKNPLLGFVAEVVNGKSYYSSYVTNEGSSGTVLRVSGNFASRIEDGLWRFLTNSTAESVSTNCTARLCYKPID